MNTVKGRGNTNDEISVYVESKEDKFFILTFKFRVIMAEVQFSYWQLQASIALNFFIFPVRIYLASYFTARAEVLLYSSTEDNIRSANLCAIYSCVLF